MSIIKFPTKKLNMKKVTVFLSLAIFLLIILILGIIYFFNSSFREFTDIHIFRKQLNQNNLPTIEINPNEDQFVWAYDKYIALLNKNILYSYNTSGQIAAQNDVYVSTPLFCNSNKFLVVAEKNGNSLYLVSGTNILWHNKLEGNISNISVNKNGYVSAILSGTNYKSIVVSFDSKGNELFKTYISSNLATSTVISNDNKYLSIAEIDYSGSIIKSAVKNISIEKAKTDPTNSVVFTYNLPDNELLTNIKYQDKSNLVCMTNSSIILLNITDKTDSKIIDFENSFEFIDINLKNNFIYTTNKLSGFSNTAIINIYNVNNNSKNTFEFNGSIKSVCVNWDKIAINTGSEIYFIGLNGWLIKKYTSYNEINNIVIGENIAGIIYKNKIEIVEI